MPVKLVYERPDIHREYSAVKSITMELADERTLEEMREGFDDFLKAVGFHIPLEEDDPYTFNRVSEDTITLTGVDDMWNVDGDIDTGPLIFNLDDMYGATTTKLKDD